MEEENHGRTLKIVNIRIKSRIIHKMTKNSNLTVLIILRSSNKITIKTKFKTNFIV